MNMGNQIICRTRLGFVYNIYIVAVRPDFDYDIEEEIK